MFETCITTDKHGKERLSLITFRYRNPAVRVLMAGSIKGRILTMVKKIHRYTHATEVERESIFSDARILHKDISAACTKVYKACEICLSTEEPKQRKKISLNQVNEAFNQELEADIIVVIQNVKQHVLNMVDMGTGYGKRVKSETHEAKAQKQLIEVH